MSNVIDFTCSTYTEDIKCIWCDTITEDYVEVNIKMIPRLKDKMKGHHEKDYIGIVYCCDIHKDDITKNTYTGWDDWDIYDNIIESCHFNKNE